MTNKQIALDLDWSLREAGLSRSDATQTALDIIAFVNVAEPSVEDLKPALRLAIDGQLRGWSCPICGDRVLEAEGVEDWSRLQGARQTDRASYPGDGPSDPRCDHCRCHDRRKP